ncbi:MAG: UDP-glucose 6-dehydrogenase [Candidatus Marinimicrobia bacterium]|nr:UDP-glucose 6-dehydrogenase [Candidatus Neomarinimicrobiota bacterium]|tara:strand:+ start:5536 stop:6747 length:1212 start_codon:yes stop_codon:yes gene_type:complete
MLKEAVVEITVSKKITIVGAGYVGMSLSSLLAKENQVMVLDIDPEKIKKINNNESTIQDEGLKSYLSRERSLSLKATVNTEEAYKDADYVIICTPTDFDSETNQFNTDSIDHVIEDVITERPEATIIIKSTVPVGYTHSRRKKFNTNKIIFSPEFLREGRALEDNLYPSRIIVGDCTKEAKNFADILRDSAKKQKIDLILCDSSEAEAIKLFSNTYLAMRVAFFNELDTFSIINGLDAKNIIEGVSLDNRIGKGYNNPSFGYGGYCLPKDTRQLLSHYSEIPQKLIEAVVSSNETRIELIVNQIKNEAPKDLGIYRLSMKQDSDNFRSSSILRILDILKNENINFLIFEPKLASNYKFDFDYKHCMDINEFKKNSDLIITNRMHEDLFNVKHKVYTRDIFNDN